MPMLRLREGNAHSESSFFLLLDSGLTLPHYTAPLPTQAGSDENQTVFDPGSDRGRRAQFDIQRNYEVLPLLEEESGTLPLPPDGFAKFICQSAFGKMLFFVTQEAERLRIYVLPHR
jgi:hypothetical protein